MNTHVNTTAPTNSTTALYCRATGTRLAPTHGLAPTGGTPIAIAVFHDGSSVPLFGDSVLGRAPELDRRVVDGVAQPINLPDTSLQVSRCHALLRIDRWQVELIDLGSRNGTSLSNGHGTWEPLIPGLATIVEDGQLVRLGSTALRIHRLAR